PRRGLGHVRAPDRVRLASALVRALAAAARGPDARPPAADRDHRTLRLDARDRGAALMAELELIAAIERMLGVRGDALVRGPGDDAAVVRAAGAVAVTSIDAMVEDVHFRLSTPSPGDVGHRALAAALSDLAAMGARPGEAYVALGLPSGFGEKAALELVQAMEELAERTGTTIAG